MDMSSSSSLPAWLRQEITLRTVGVVTRSETVEQLHARMLAEQGLVWDDNTQTWKAAK